MMMAKTIKVGVSFINGSQVGTVYSYMSDIEGLGVGDLVVLETNSGYHIAKIMNLNYISDVTPERYVIQKVDITTHLERKAKYLELKSLKSEMAELKSNLDEFLMYSLLAEKSPEMFKLFMGYKELTGGE